MYKAKDILTKSRTYEFDKNRDLKRVEPASVLCISEILSSGVVPPDANELDFNDIDDPDNVGSHVTNVFDAVDIQKGITPSQSVSTPSESPSSEGGSE